MTARHAVARVTFRPTEAYFGSERTARRYRALGKYPPYIRIGRRIFLRPKAIEEWLVQNETIGAAI